MNTERTGVTLGDPEEATRETTRGAPVEAPATDIYETEGTLVLLVELPGVEIDAASVTLENNQLSIAADAHIAPPTGYTLTHEEFAPVHYARSFALSETVSGEDISASMKNGVLKLTLAKASAAKARRIAIKGE